jgi:predicted amidohydrolase
VKETVSVAAVQMDIAWLDPEKNVEKMLMFIGEVMSENPVDLVVFPELANTGYVKGLDPSFGSAYLRKAETIPGPTTDALSASAREHGIHIVVGICQLHPQISATVYNSAVLIGPSGDILGVHHKMHIPREEKHYFYPGNTVEVFNTDLGCLGLVICYDLVFPELLRVLALKGAEIICACINGLKREPPIPRYNEYLAVTRANENKNFVVLCSRVGADDEIVFDGRSVIAGPRAEILSQSPGEAEEVLYATLERKVLFEARAALTVFQDRRPEMYALLAQPL